MPLKKVLVVGAGPSGLLLAVFMAKAGIPVEVLEANDDVDQSPRATYYGPPAMHELHRAGVAEDIIREGYKAKNVCWRKLDGSFIAGLNHEDLGDYENRTITLHLQRICGIFIEHINRSPIAKISWKHKVTGLGQDEDKAWVDVETPEGNKRMEADYIAGCDGANSVIRRGLFGKDYPGFTWEKQIVATNTYYDFEKFGFWDANFIIHPQHYYMAARIDGKGLWRVTYGEEWGLSQEEIEKRQPWKFETILPGHPKPGDYKILNISPYKIHQRCAQHMRVGRFVLAADAGHLCNPFGGLGLTGGIVDVGGLADCLTGIHEGKADPSILDIYDEVRRAKWREIIDPISSDNVRRVSEQDPEEAINKDPFLVECKKTESDKEYSKEMQLGVLEVVYDFKKHYKNASTDSPRASL